MSTLRMFHNQKASAKQRGIAFNLTYAEWLSIWEASGRLSERGRGPDRYVMARTGDVGAYEVGNVYITTGAQNAADAAANGRLDGRRIGKDATPEELALNRRTPPDNVTAQIRAEAKTYRQAVRLAWNLRRVQTMTRQQLAADAELYASHATDYLHEDDSPKRRNLPADALARFEAAVGNTLVSQWLAARSQLTVLEELQATKVFASTTTRKSA